MYAPDAMLNFAAIPSLEHTTQVNRLKNLHHIKDEA